MAGSIDLVAGLAGEAAIFLAFLLDLLRFVFAGSTSGSALSNGVFLIGATFCFEPPGALFALLALIACHSPAAIKSFNSWISGPAGRDVESNRRGPFSSADHFYCLGRSCGLIFNGANCLRDL